MAIEQEVLFIDDFDDEQEITLDPQREALLQIQLHAKEMAKSHAHRFFKDFSLHTGGKIPSAMLNNDRRISMIMNYSIINGVDHAHKMLTVDQQEIQRDSHATTIIQILNKISAACVPQEFAGGILCVYLELIEGCSF